MTELKECDRHTKALLCHRLSPALLIRINLAWLKMQMAQRHWWSFHVFITFNWFNYMENEMVGCAIKCSPPSSPSCQSRQRDDYSLMPRRQGNEISRSSSRSFSFSISASRRPLLWFVEAGKDFFFFFFIVITQNVLVWVWEAPTLLCGPRALLKFKEFPPTVHHFRLAVYMVLAGGRRVLIIPAVVFHPWTSIHPETPTPREDQRSSQTDLISLHRIYEYFYQPSFDLSVSVKHNSFLFYLKIFFFARNGPLEFLFATLSVV